MKSFTKQSAKQILANEIKVEDLFAQYPEYQEQVLKEIERIKKSNPTNFIGAIIDQYSAKAKLAKDKIDKSALNQKTIDAFLPEIIKARFALYLLEQFNKTVVSGQKMQSMRLNRWDGTILQKLLFKTGLERKPVALGRFKFFWTFIKNKKALMPLLNEKGIYCFFSRELIRALAELMQGRNCLEIAAGDGMLTRFLNEEGVACKATDDYSWGQYIAYPDFVERADAKAALKKYAPEVVICCWPVPKNTYEKYVFQTDSVQIYIVIGTQNARITSNFELYNSVGNHFTMELNQRLSEQIIPPSPENAVYIFRRK